MEYVYNELDECFRRVDNKGRPLWVNITEARQIENLVNLGYSVEDIKDKVKLSHRKAGRYAIVSMIKNIKEGNIDLDGDYAIPESQFDEINDEIKITALENRVSNLENAVVELNKPTKKSVFGRIKSWF